MRHAKPAGAGWQLLFASFAQRFAGHSGAATGCAAAAAAAVLAALPAAASPGGLLLLLLLRRWRGQHLLVVREAVSVLCAVLCLRRVGRELRRSCIGARAGVGRGRYCAQELRVSCLFKSSQRQSTICPWCAVAQGAMAELALLRRPIHTTMLRQTHKTCQFLHVEM